MLVEDQVGHKAVACWTTTLHLMIKVFRFHSLPKKGTHIHRVHHVASLSPIEPNSLAGHGVQLKFRKPEQLKDLVEYPI